MINRVGVDDDEGPPVPIPNTEVKLSGAEDTWLVTAWENREMPTQTRGLREGAVLLYSSLAQSVEHAAVNRRVVGSSPTGGARMWLAATVAVTASLLFKRCGTVWAFSSVG